MTARDTLPEVFAMDLHPSFASAVDEGMNDEHETASPTNDDAVPTTMTHVGSYDLSDDGHTFSDDLTAKARDVRSMEKKSEVLLGDGPPFGLVNKLNAVSKWVVLLQCGEDHLLPPRCCTRAIYILLLYSSSSKY